MSTLKSHEAPFQMQLKQDGQGRISRKIEYVAGREPRVRNYEYDDDGLLTGVRNGDGHMKEQYLYDQEGRRDSAWWMEPEMYDQKLYYSHSFDGPRLSGINNTGIIHSEDCFRLFWSHPDKTYFKYEYSPDYRLHAVHHRDDDDQAFHSIEFDHDHEGRRCEKYENGQLVELYDWHNLIRLARAQTPGLELEFHYREGERTPAACTYNGEHLLYLYYDQVGSLRVVADEYGRVLKEVRYTAFGVIEEDTNPGLYMPIGFAGGLHDRDISWVRFGYRDYDPLTARFTAKDPMGYAAGDSDLRGYCFDDPVNLVDPTGLKSKEANKDEGFWDTIGESLAPSVDPQTDPRLKKAGADSAERPSRSGDVDPDGHKSGFWGGVGKIGAGLGEVWDKAPAGIGEAVTKGAAGTAEAFGKLGEAYATNKDLQKYTAIALGAGALPIVAAAAPEALPAIGRAIAPHADKIAKGTRAAAAVAKGKAKEAATATAGTILSNPEKVSKIAKEAGDFISSAAFPGAPENSVGGYAGTAAKWLYDEASESVGKKGQGNAIPNIKRRNKTGR